MNVLPRQSGIKTTTLVLLIIGAIDSIRNLPATALFGSSLIFFFIASAIVFLIPAALVSSELSASHPGRAGIYHWAQLAFGDDIAFLAVWLQWINTMVWFPSILCFVAGTAAYLLNPSWAQDQFYLVSVILMVFWVLTFINLRGIHTSVKFANFCSIVGMVIPMLLIISMSWFWIWHGNPIHVHLSIHNILPSLSKVDNWVSLTAIMTSFLGIELATVHIKAVHEPHITFPRALLCSVLIILFTMIMGSLAIAFVLPSHKINLVAGIMQAFAEFLSNYHLLFCLPLVTVILLLGSLGNMVSWVISPAKGLLQAANSGYLPKVLTYENEHGVASYLLIVQAVLVSAFCLAFIYMPSVNGSYWLLSALSTELYMLMYVIMFVAAMVLKYRAKEPLRSTSTFCIPGGLWGTCLVATLGLIGCFITLFVGFFPPSGINVGDPIHYKIIFLIGILLMVSPALIVIFSNSLERRV